MLLFVFFKQKTAYEVRISDGSSDVCSSVLIAVSLKGSGGALAAGAPECREKHQTRQAARLCSEVLDDLPGGVAGGPRPLEIEAAEPAGDIKALADEMEPRHLLRLEGLGGELVGVDAAGGHLGGAAAPGTGRLQAPAGQPVRPRARVPVRTKVGRETGKEK